MSHTIRYTLSIPDPNQRFLALKATFPCKGQGRLLLQLPAWRPGRYELGNFAKNIQYWRAEGKDGQALSAYKVGKETWEVNCAGQEEVTVHYNYYADQLNAGSTWVDATQMYVNPVNCFLFQPNFPDSKFQINLDLPASYSVATGMEVDKHQLTAYGVQQLLDCPFMAAEDLWHRSYKVQNVTYNIWIKGKHRLDVNRLLNEFKAFTVAQLESFKEIPCKEYHFLFQFPDHPSRHGVEHENSTVITLGPAEKLLTTDGYDELLGISSHELYHTWNIKSIRPAEMMPYDFTKENYSRLGYVAEGVTTYYGDLYLLRSGVWTIERYLKELSGQIQRHLHNAGRFNLSVADSSFDTWIDGYERGIPHRKVSIYTEGCLTAFLTDIAIQKATRDKRSLDDVMRHMYDRFGKKSIGYTESDYLNVVNEVAGENLGLLFEHFVYGTEDYLPALRDALDYLGLELNLSYPSTLSALAGLTYQITPNGTIVTEVWPEGPAQKAGLTRGDTITHINETPADVYFEQTLHLAKGSLTLEINRDRIKRSTVLETDEKRYYPTVEILVPKSHNKGFLSWSWTRR